MSDLREIEFKVKVTAHKGRSVRMIRADIADILDQWSAAEDCKVKVARSYKARE